MSPEKIIKNFEIIKPNYENKFEKIGMEGRLQRPLSGTPADSTEFTPRQDRIDILRIARDTVLRLSQENNRLRGQNNSLVERLASSQLAERRLREELAFLKKELDNSFFLPKKQSASREETDAADPKGYCKALGLDPRLLRTLSRDKLDKLLFSLRNAYAMAIHSDRGGDDEQMKKINVAFSFLNDPQNRASYGR